MGCESLYVSVCEGVWVFVAVFFIYFGWFSVELHSLERIRNKQTATVILRFVFFFLVRCPYGLSNVFFSSLFYLSISLKHTRTEFRFSPKNFNTGSLTMSFLRLLLTKTNGFFHPKRSNGSVSFTIGVWSARFVCELCNHNHFLSKFILYRRISFNGTSFAGNRFRYWNFHCKKIALWYFSSNNLNFFSQMSLACVCVFPATHIKIHTFVSGWTQNTLNSARDLKMSWRVFDYCIFRFFSLRFC